MRPGRTMMEAVRLLGLSLVIISVACSADAPSGDGDGDGDDAGVDNGELSAPILDGLPATTPLETVAVRGMTVGTRVVTQGTADGSVLTAVLPGGSFCVDTALATGAPTEMLVYAVGGDGRISEPVSIEVTRDIASTPPADPTCSGTGAVDCDGDEICDNDKDDDCDGYVDSCDTSCNGCIEDVFEPNDVAVDVPMIPAGTHTLQICPCRDDWFAFQRTSVQRVRATATFDSASISINMRLYRAGPGGLGEADLVDSSITAGDVEDIDFDVLEDGLYYLRVYSPLEGQRGSYELTVN